MSSSGQAWFVAVGLRVFDIAVLALWVFWCIRLRYRPDGGEEDGGGGGGGEPPEPPESPRGGGGRELRFPCLPDADPWPARRRGHELIPRTLTRPGHARRPEHPRPARRRSPAQR